MFNMEYQGNKDIRSGNGHSTIFNELFGSAVNFLIKLILGILGGNKAAKYSGKFRYRLTKWIASKTINWK